MSVRLLWVGAGASPSLLEPRSLPGSGLVIFHLQLLSQNSDWRKTAGRREGAGRGRWPGRTSLALDLASRRLPLGTFWRRLAELCLPDTSPLLPWMIPCVVLSWKGSRVSLRREKKFPYQPCVVSKHWSLTPTPAGTSSFQAGRLDSSGLELFISSPCTPERVTSPQGDKSYLMEGPSACL